MMTSNPKAFLHVPKSSDGSTSTPQERRTTSSIFSESTKGHSIASSETGESSITGSKRSSLATMTDEVGETGQVEDLTNSKTGDSKRRHRSHRSSNSGGFLLSKTPFDSPSSNILQSDHSREQHRSSRDYKGKAVSNQDKRHTKKSSNIGLAISGSPLANNITSAAGEYEEEAHSISVNVGKKNESSVAKGALDVDSAQIVNLALNLSESRRNAARRNVSSPLPPLASTFGEGFAGGSLRQHLQQQRRASRNISPKPQRASTSSPRVTSAQNNNPSTSTFDSQLDGYQYHFTPSTLARADRAKNQIELMYHYRRLLQYVPPLQPQVVEMSTTPSGTAPGSPISSHPLSRKSSNIALSNVQPGRPYNPLQYIRNRKVRARERKGIDGQAQGFADLEKVSSWVDEISGIVERSQSAGYVSLPVFSKEAESAASPQTSPQSAMGKSPTAAVKVKRPRIDWEVNPADMLADVFWLEQDDNKKVVEDRLGRRIFPQASSGRRPVAGTKDLEPYKTPEQRRPMSPDLRIDTKLPEFRSLKADSDKHSDSTTSRVRHRIRDAARIHHGRNGSSREAQQFSRARSRSSSDSSDAGSSRRLRRIRSSTVDSSDRGRDILEKQMLEMLDKEAQEKKSIDSCSERGIEHTEYQKPALKDGIGKPRNSVELHSRSGSIAEDHLKRNSLKLGSSGRGSLEVPGSNPRRSLEELDSTAPNSPQLQAKLPGAFVPSIAMDLSPPPRQNSPSRNPLSRVKSKINPFDHGRARSRGRADTYESINDAIVIDEQIQESPETPEGRKRSVSPMKKVISRRTDDSSKSSSRGSIRRGKTNDGASGIRGLFKGSRGPVARVSDFLWKKDSTSMGASSGFSTDESDIDDTRGIPIKSGKGSRESSTGLTEAAQEFSRKRENPSYLSEMPTFTSPFDGRGRTTESRGSETKEGDGITRQPTHESRRKTSRTHLFSTPPRIDIQDASPASSPDLGPIDSYHGSDVSDIESQRGSLSNGVKSADARLNYILGMPGPHGPVFPVTGHYNVEARRGSRPSLEYKRQWSISDRGVSVHRGPMTKREIARVRALLLCSGIKANEISRRAAEIKDLNTTDESPYSGIAKFSQHKAKLAPKSQAHIIAAKILSEDIQLSKQVWQVSADVFCNTTIQNLVDRVEDLQTTIVETLTPMARKAADEADEVSRDLITSQTLKVKHVIDTMDKMLRRRRRRFRWLRRGGWVVVEWALVGVMWMVWFLVVFVRVVIGVGKGVAGAARWLLWL